MVLQFGVRACFLLLLLMRTTIYSKGALTTFGAVGDLCGNLIFIASSAFAYDALAGGAEKKRHRRND